MVLLFKLLSRLPLTWMQSLGGLLGAGVWWCSKRYREEFISNAKRLGLTPEVIRKARASAGQMVGELPWMWFRPREVSCLPRVQWDGLALFEAGLKRGQGVMVLSPHLGCWEIGAQMLAERFGPSHGPLMAMYRPARKAWLNRLLQFARDKPHLKSVPATSGGVREIFRHLKRGGYTALLPDQVPPEGQGVWAQFLGERAYTMTLAVKLARQTGATVLLCWCERLPQGQFIGHLSALEDPLLTDPEASVLEGCQAMNNAVERLVRAHPDQYLWGYRRFKAPRRLFGESDSEGLSTGVAQHPTQTETPLDAQRPRSDSPGAWPWLMTPLSWLPLPVLRFVGRVIGVSLYALAARRSRITRRNLALCFPQWNEAQVHQVARAVFIHFAQAWLDRSWLWHGRARVIQARLTLNGDAQGLALLKSTLPLVIFAPHFVGLDVGWTQLTLKDFRPLLTIYTPQSSASADQWMKEGRERFGRVGVGTREDGVRALIKGIKAGAGLYLLPDMNFGPEESIFVPFFGVQAATVPSLSKFAKLSSAQVLPVTTRLTPTGYDVVVHAPWENYPTADARADTLRMNQWLEGEVRAHVEQYFWLHKRFKTRPPGEAPLY
jgi:Kdo2-lipid IVA lauroyltransferase/acyltransferase